MSLFILHILMMFSLGVIVFLAAAALPRISDTETTAAGRNKTNWWSSLPFEKIDVVFNSFLEKFLRRIKLFLMKLDNALTRRLGKYRKNNSQNNSGNHGNGFGQ